MNNPNFWKDQYSPFWALSKRREEAVASLIMQATGKIVIGIGLGAGSDDYLPGTAAQQGYEKGGADLAVEGTNVRLEVTGPQTERVKAHAPL